ncbi:MAG: PIN domain-containing protein [Candidatus Omnitrophota bacterium]|nr:MAG: PIN domain-containing protein [Candidatus Omnitrophota bacterium]
MITYVIDASVAVKWVIEEVFRLEAKRFLHPCVFCIAPDLIEYECISAFQQKVARNEISEQAAWQCYTTLFHEMPLQLEDSTTLTYHAFQLANRINHAVYDCYYLALAEQEKAFLVTADRKFYERVMGSPYAHRIRWVEEPPAVARDPETEGRASSPANTDRDVRDSESKSV